MNDMPNLHADMELLGVPMEASQSQSATALSVDLWSQ